jgi:predicted 2-oxoglutarate/Fe(II)-dependent dioxygenase YbiX/peroxiredoxin
MLTPGDPAPWFTARSTVNPSLQFESVGGRYIVLSFLGSAEDEAGRRVLDEAIRDHSRFDLVNSFFVGVSTGPDARELRRVGVQYPGIILIGDFDKAVSRRYGAAVGDGPSETYRPHSLVLDPRVRVLAAIPIEGDGRGHVDRVLALIDAQPPVESLQGFAPVLVVPQVFEPEFCRRLIDYYDQTGGRESGFMRDVGGKTVEFVDPMIKRREDCHITDPALAREAQLKVGRRLIPEIYKAFQFHATRMERDLIACYDAATGGKFHAHRDNTTKGTAHRRFAVTLNLNGEEYEGGDLRFPEFGPRTYRAPTGGAVAFSCSLLHEATVVTKGRRYVYLPFLFDEPAARIREANIGFIDGTVVHR